MKNIFSLFYKAFATLNMNQQKKKRKTPLVTLTLGKRRPLATGGEKQKKITLLWYIYCVQAAVPVPAGPPLSSASSRGRCSVPALCSVPAERAPRPCPPRAPLSAPRAASCTPVYKTRNTAFGFTSVFSLDAKFTVIPMFFCVYIPV